MLLSLYLFFLYYVFSFFFNDFYCPRCSSRHTAPLYTAPRYIHDIYNLKYYISYHADISTSTFICTYYPTLYFSNAIFSFLVCCVSTQPYLIFYLLFFFYVSFPPNLLSSLQLQTTPLLIFFHSHFTSHSSFPHIAPILSYAFYILSNHFPYNFICFSMFLSYLCIY